MLNEFPPSYPDSTFEQAERRRQELQAQHEAGLLDEISYRLEVARLLLRDEHGVFWMLDADSGQWFCNHGSGWQPADLGVEAAPVAPRPAPDPTHRPWRALVIAGLLLIAVTLLAAAVLGRWPAGLWARIGQTRPAAAQPVVIASPAEGSRVAVGQEVAVESTVSAAAAWVELQVAGESVDRRDLRAYNQDGPRFLSQLWRPTVAGDVPLAVVVLAADGQRLGAATVTVHVVPANDALPGADCTPSAALVADVTIHPGMAFPPGARMDKVWQVQNSGACAWGSGYELVFAGGQQLGAPNAIPVPVAPSGGTVALPITFWAPASSGAYTSTWQLRSPSGDFFGPTLILDVRVQAQAVQQQSPAAPVNLKAAVEPGGQRVSLSWEDRSGDEDAFRIYRQEVEASIGLAPANAQSFVDEQVACGHTYLYTVVAFNAAGGSPSEDAMVTLPPCPPASLPPTLILSVMPAELTVSGTFTVSFVAHDDLGVAQVQLWGQGTGDPLIDATRVISCTGVECTGEWPLTWTGPASVTLTIAGVAIDAAGQESEQATVTVLIRSRR